jgi:Tfp pilus assembly protein PilV
MRNDKLGHRPQRGFSIIEALIAGLVLSFGTLALVGVQVSLSRNSDVARQRTEATRLAQDKMEEFRAFGSTGTVVGVTTYDSLADSVSPEVISNANNTAVSLNTAYNRSWTVAPGASDESRNVRVQVAWTDRSGQAQAVSLSSVIAKSSFVKAAELMGTSLNRGFDDLQRQRDNNVPYPAIDIGNDRSIWRWPTTGGQWYVFDNNDGSVRYSCTVQLQNGDDPAANANCTAILGYVLAGYVSTVSSNAPNQDFDTELGTWTVNSCSLSNPVNVDPASSAPCFLQPVVVSSLINQSCPYIVSGNNISGSEIARLRFYKCYAMLIVVSDPDAGWGGRVEFATAPTGNEKICRFTNNTAFVSSSGVYSDVDTSLNNQNYFARRNGNCATGQTQHQPQP